MEFGRENLAFFSALDSGGEKREEEDNISGDKWQVPLIPSAQRKG